MSKPRIFIGSSSEGMDVANAVFRNLESFSEPTTWKQNVFQLSQSFITSLMSALDKFDFAVFVFAPDDVAIIRNQSHHVVRDNIIFETGLFAGRYGIDRVFFLKPQGIELHLPSDLLGLMAGEYATDRRDRNLLAATSSFCERLREVIQEKDMKISVISESNQKQVLDLKSIQIYLDEKGWTSISFTKASENINPRFTEEYLMELIEAFPDKVRRCRLSAGKFGIKLVGKPI